MKRQRCTYVLAFTIIHLVAALAALFWAFRVSSDAMEGRPVTWLGKHLAGRLVDVLWFPVRPAVEALQQQGLWLPPVLQWVILISNSLLWGLMAALLWALVERGVAAKDGVVNRRAIDGGENL